MDQSTFERLTRRLSGSISRRAVGVALAVVATIPWLADTSTFEPNPAAGRRRRRKPDLQGPCGDGSGPDNRCTKHRHCCTNF